VAAHALRRRDPEERAAALEESRRHWARLVSRFLDMGEPMADAMVAAARIVAFARTGPLVLDGAQDTRRSRPTNPPPASGVRRRR
jgi:hypothetical protein